VVCVGDGDCGGAGEVCHAGQCVVACASTNDCTDPQVCDTVLGQCVECTENRGCALDHICSDDRCVLGCEGNADCDQANGEGCDLRAGSPGTCVVTCSSNADCDLGSNCDGTTCVFGCAGSDERCPNHDVCVGETCRPECQQSSDCNNGETCVVAEGACEPGCQTNDDCGGITRVCDAAAGTVGTCVECDVDDDCGQNGQGNANATCDAHLCRITCDPSQLNGRCIGAGSAIGGVCDPSDDLCVECLSDGDCGTGQTCDAASRSCVAAAGGSTLCQGCNSDDECGAGNLCIARTAGGVLDNERVCGLDCSASACPQGFACNLIERQNAVIGAQCQPSNSALDNETCAAFLDTASEASCTVGGFGGDGCGLALDANDAFCLQPDDQAAGTCSVACDIDSDCPTGFRCDPVNLPNVPAANACVPG
jgi:Cys-rich repeat protein